MADKGLFGDLFDINNDGKLDFFERSMEFALLSELIREEEDDDSPEITDADIDFDDLLLMDEDELEEAGLDPDDFFF